jgi:hypothetical protein
MNYKNIKKDLRVPPLIKKQIHVDVVTLKNAGE